MVWRVSLFLVRHLVAACLLLLFSNSARASFDPSLTWYTLKTPHFVLHFHQGLESLAQSAAQKLELARALLENDFLAGPKEKIHVILSDVSDSANGSAASWIRPTIHLLAVPPDSRSELNDYQDYFWNLIIHEYTHIAHLSKTGGLPSWSNTVFGKIWLPNGFLPSWFSEGLAVHYESFYSDGGRIRSSLYNMFIRTQLLENSFYKIDDISANPTTWPRGKIPYLYGSRFMHWIAKRYGHKYFANLVQNYGEQIIPFALNDVASEELGSSYLQLYSEWLDELKHECTNLVQQIRSSEVTTPKSITSEGEYTGEPLFLDRDNILYLSASSNSKPKLRLKNVGDLKENKIVDLYGYGTLAISPDKKTALVSQIVPYNQFYFFEDLFQVDLKSGNLRQITFGQRLTDPDYSPDGHTVVAIQRFTGGKSALVLLSPSGGNPYRIIYSAPENHVVYTPRFSPDGKSIAFSEQRPEGRDIRILYLESNRLVDVTRDRALDLDPTYHPEGEYLLFSSDRTGVYNLYAYNISQKTSFQVTNVLTGAFRPAVSPDGQKIVLVSYSTRGYDLALLPFAPSLWKNAPLIDLTRPKVELPSISIAKYQVNPYQPLHSLWPQYWMPILSQDPSGTSIGFYTSGTDILGRHLWNLQTEWGLTSNEPAFMGSYTARTFFPELQFALGSFLSLTPAYPQRLERQSFLSLSSLFSFSRLNQQFSLSIGYELRYYDPFSLPAPNNPIEPKRYPAEKGLAATVSLGCGFSTAERTPNSFSFEKGQVLGFTIRGANRETVSQFRYLSITGSFTHYQSLPGLSHFVLATHFSGGAGWGDLGNRRVFQLGGLTIDNLSSSLFSLSSNRKVIALRGYPPGAFAGNRFVLVNTELRFPIADINAGAWTLPFYVRRIFAAATFDIGQAADRILLRELKPSAGGEANIDLLLGYSLPAILHLGYSRGISSPGIHNVYFTLGGEF